MISWQDNFLFINTKSKNFNSPILLSSKFKSWLVVCTTNKIYFLGKDEIVLPFPSLSIDISSNIYIHNKLNKNVYKISDPLCIEEFVFNSPFFVLKYVYMDNIFILELDKRFVLRVNDKFYIFCVEQKSSNYIEEYNDTNSRNLNDNNYNRKYFSTQNSIFNVQEVSESILYTNNIDNTFMHSQPIYDLFVYNEYIILIYKNIITFVKYENKFKFLNTFTLNEPVLITKNIKMNSLLFLQINNLLFFKENIFCKLSSLNIQTTDKRSRKYFPIFWKKPDKYENKIIKCFNIDTVLKVIKTCIDDGSYKIDQLFRFNEKTILNRKFDIINSNDNYKVFNDNKQEIINSNDNYKVFNDNKQEIINSNDNYKVFNDNKQENINSNDKDIVFNADRKSITNKNLESLQNININDIQKMIYNNGQEIITNSKILNNNPKNKSTTIPYILKPIEIKKIEFLLETQFLKTKNTNKFLSTWTKYIPNSTFLNLINNLNKSDLSISTSKNVYDLLKIKYVRKFFFKSIFNEFEIGNGQLKVPVLESEQFKYNIKDNLYNKERIINGKEKYNTICKIKTNNIESNLYNNTVESNLSKNTVESNLFNNTIEYNLSNNTKSNSYKNTKSISNINNTDSISNINNTKSITNNNNLCNNTKISNYTITNSKLPLKTLKSVLPYKIIYNEQTNQNQKTSNYKKLNNKSITREINYLLNEEILKFELDENDTETKKEKDYLLKISSNIGKALFYYNRCGVNKNNLNRTGKNRISKNETNVSISNTDNPSTINSQNNTTFLTTHNNTSTTTTDNITTLNNHNLTSINEDLKFLLIKNGQISNLNIKDKTWKNWPNFNFGCYRTMTLQNIDIEKFFNSNTKDEYFKAGLIFGLGLLQKFKNMDFLTLKNKLDTEISLMSLLVSFGISNINIRDSEYEEYCYDILNDDSSFLLRLAAITGLSYTFRNTNNIKIRTYLLSEIYNEGVFISDKFNKSNIIWYDKTYRIINTLNLARVICNTSEYIECNDKLCEIILNGICLNNIQKYKKKFRRIRGVPLDEMFYSGLFLEFVQQDNNIKNLCGISNGVNYSNNRNEKRSNEMNYICNNGETSNEERNNEDNNRNENSNEDNNRNENSNEDNINDRNGVRRNEINYICNNRRISNEDNSNNSNEDYNNSNNERRNNEDNNRNERKSYEDNYICNNIKDNISSNNPIYNNRNIILEFNNEENKSCFNNNKSKINNTRNENINTYDYKCNKNHTNINHINNDNNIKNSILNKEILNFNKRLEEINNLSISVDLWDIYKYAGIIFHYAVSNYSINLSSTHIQTLLIIEKKMLQNSNFKILFDYLLITFCLLNNNTTLDLLRIIRRQLLRSERSKTNYTTNIIILTRTGIKNEFKTDLSYGDIEKYKMCLSVLIIKLEKTKYTKLDLISTFYINWPSHPSEQDFFNIFRYSIINSICKIKHKEYRMEKYFKKEFLLLDSVHKKYVIDVLSDFYENYKGKDGYVIDIDKFKDIVIRSK